MSRAAIDASLKTLASGKQLFQVFANQGFVALGQRNQGMELMGILFVDFKVLKSGPINGDVPEVRIQPDNQRRSGEVNGHPGQTLERVSHSLATGHDSMEENPVPLIFKQINEIVIGQIGCQSDE